MPNLKKLQKLVAQVDGESVTNLTREELQETISQIIDFLAEMTKRNRNEFSQVSSQLGKDLQQIRAGLQSDVERYKGDLSRAAGIEIINGFRARLESIEDRIQARLAELRDGKDGVSPDIDEVVEKLKPFIPEGSPDTGEIIRNKLENLEGDDRLSVDAISGVDERIRKIAPPSGGGGAHALHQLADVDVQSTKPTNGQALAYSSSLDRWIPSNAGAGDLISTNNLSDVSSAATSAHNLFDGTAFTAATVAGTDKVLIQDTDGSDVLKTATAQSVADLAAPEGTAIKSTGEAGGSKFLREDGDGTSSWQTLPSQVSDAAYGAGWNGDTTTAPSKNAVYDEIELRAPKASPTFTGTVTLPTGLTGVLRADSGVVSTDDNVTDIVSAASDSAAGKVELATIAETNTGTDTGRAVTPDGLAGSVFGTKGIGIQVTDGSGAITTGDGKAYFRVPASMNGMNIIAVAASLTAPSTSGNPTIMIARGRQASAGSAHSFVDVLSTAITIDANEYDSKDATTAAVINGSNDDLATGDLLRIDVDGVGSGPTAVLSVNIEAQLP